MAKKAPKQPLTEQIAIAAIGKAFPHRTTKLADDSVREGESKHIKAVIEIDGVVSRGLASEQSASASPLQDALLALLVRGMDKRALAAKRRAAMKLVRDAQAAGCAVAKHLAATDPEYAALINDVKAQAANELPAVAKKGSLKFNGSAVVSSATVTKA